MCLLAGLVHDRADVRSGQQRQRRAARARSAPARRGCRPRPAGAAARRGRRSARPAAARGDLIAHRIAHPFDALVACRPRSASGKPSSTRSAPYASTRLVRPGDRVRVVDHQRRAAATPISRPGNDAKPPMPSTTSGGGGKTRQRLPARHEQRERPSSSVRSSPCRARRETRRTRTRRRAAAPASLPCPSRVPSQNTRQPRASEFAATARPGNTCPPVPPAMIMTVHASGCSAHTVTPASARRFS